MISWFKRFFQCRVRSSLVLDMHPADEVVCMTIYRNYLIIASRMGQTYWIDGDKLVEFKEAEISVGGPAV